MQVRKIHLLDSFFVFLNLSTCYSIIPYLLFHLYNRYIILIILFFLNIFYILFRFKRIFRPIGHPLFGLYIVISISCILSAFVTDTGWSSATVYMFSNVSFYFLLYQLYKDYSTYMDLEHCILSMLTGYVLLAALSVVNASLVFILIKAGVISPTTHLVNSMADLFSDNVNRMGQMYYFPYYLSLVEASGMGIRIPFFQDSGFVLGYYHEPHCFTFMTFPALFILLYKSKKLLYKIILVALYLFIMLICSSTMNIIGVLCCLFLYILFLLRKNIKQFVLFFVFTLFLVFVGMHYIDLGLFQFMFDKIDGSGGSAGFSQSMMLFAFTPRTLLGSSFYNLHYVDWNNPEIRTADVGFISFTLNLIFMGICAVKMFKLFWKKDSFSMALFFFAAYFFIHSTKVAMVSYSLSMLIFVCFILTLATKRLKKGSALKKDEMQFCQN